MSNCMVFPETFDEFAEIFGFVDSKEYYTNGSELIQVFRVKQWLEHENNRQQAEIERLQKELALKGLEYTLLERDRAKDICDFAEELKTIKAEAIKEFAERLKTNDFFANFTYKGEAQLIIDNLVKEMVGDAE